jgi:glycosyltransferase involved in cell wall biosynthesis
VIVHVITGLSRGGAESALYRLLAAQPDGSATHVVSLTDDGVFGAKLRAAGIGVTCLGMGGVAGSCLGMLALLRLLKRLRPQVVQTWMYHADLVGGIVSRLAGVPVCWGIRNGNLAMERTKRSTRVIAKVCAWLSAVIPARIVSCSTNAGAAHREFGYADRFVVIPNGLDLEVWRPAPNRRVPVRDTLGVPQDSFLVGHIGRADPQKDHANLLAAFERFAAHQPRAHLLLVGAGLSAGDEYLRTLLRGRDLGSCLTALGPRDDVPELLQALDLFVLSSAGEAFPNVVIEAMACGIPCVVTDVGDSAAIVGDAGWTVPPHDAAAMANALQEAVLESPVEHLARRDRARRRIQRDYDVNRMAIAYQKLWNEIAVRGLVCAG